MCYVDECKFERLYFKERERETFMTLIHANDIDICVNAVNRAVQLIFSSSTLRPSARIERWQLRLSQFNFKIRHQKGTTNVADYYSRHPDTKPSSRQSSTSTCSSTMLRSAHSCGDRSSNEGRQRARGSDGVHQERHRQTTKLAVGISTCAQRTGRLRGGHPTARHADRDSERFHC